MKLLLGMIGGLLAAGAAQAQPTLWGQPVEPVAAQAVRNFAICAVRQTPEGAERLLAMDFREEAYGAAVQRFVQGHSYCGRGELRATSVLFAGGLAEGLLRRGGMANDLPALLRPVERRPSLEARDETEYVGLCVAMRSPGEVQLMLRTEPGSAEERAATAAFSDDLAACVRQGQTMRLNRVGLRAILALASYRLARHNAAPAAAGS